MKKRILSLLLALVMVIGLLPVTVSAKRLDNGLEYVVYEDHVEILGYNGESTDVVIPAEIEGVPVTTINSSAFSGNSSLTSIIIPDSVTFIEEYAFHKCSNLTSIVLPNGISSIGEAAFRECSSLTTVEIPDSVSSIDASAFMSCSSLTTVEIPDGLSSIGFSAFSFCSSLATIEIPDSVSSIGGQAFYYCTSLTTVEIPDGVPSIKNSTFSHCSSLTTVEIPDSVSSIGDGAFSHCSSLTDIAIPKGVTSIGGYAFFGCSSLTSIVIPEGITSIDDYVFRGCHSLTSIVIPEGVTTIDDCAFAECSSLTSIVIPDSVTSIGGTAFFDCSSLTTVEIPYGVSSIDDSTFSHCSSLTSIVIPEGVTSIGMNAFYKCTSLTSIVIPDSVTTIDDCAFADCSSLTDIVIPEGVTSIGEQAFSWCSNLAFIVFKGNAPQFGTDVFDFITSVVLFPSNNATWTEDVMQDYGGDITWVAHDPSHDPVISAVVTDPTCTEEGYTTYTCVCGTSWVSNYVDATWHEYFPIVTDPTCTEEGYTTYTCVCGENYISDYVAALGHHFENGVCTNCGNSIGDFPALELGADLVITCPGGCYTYVTFTPETSGTYVFYSKHSDDTIASLYTTDIEELAYSDDCWDHGFHDEYSFCITYDLEAGQTYVLGVGSYSGDATDVTIRVDRNHNYEITDIKDPTCTEEGEIIWVCTECGHSYTEILPIQHCYEETVTKEPTCTEEGEAIYTCILCGDSYTDAIPTRHTYEKTVTKEPTLTEEGEAIYTCIFCGDSFTDILSSILWFEIYDDHVIVNSCSDNGNLAELVIPAEYEGLPVTGIGNWAFSDCSSLTGIVIPDSVTLICNWAFENCSSLTDIRFMGDAPEIMDYAFEDVTATACYPVGNPSWTADVMQNYSGTITWVPYDPSNPFTDMEEGRFYYEPVLWAVDNGITYGLTDTEFGTEASCKRSQVVTFLWRAAGSPAPNSTAHSFVDVKKGSFYEKAVLWAVENGITVGIDSTHFDPDAPCTRSEVVTFLWRAADKPAASGSIPFSDVPANKWYAQPVLWAVQNGITYGMTDTLFDTEGICTRAQVVTFLYRAYT